MDIYRCRIKKIGWLSYRCVCIILIQKFRREFFKEYCWEKKSDWLLIVEKENLIYLSR